jgi:RNA polymerase sigma-70 factor (ECF subfamily)
MVGSGLALSALCDPFSVGAVCGGGWVVSQAAWLAALYGVMDDADAFSLLYEREGEAVLVFLARRTLDVETAVDLTAETFAIAISSWGRVRDLGVEQARAWLFTVARRRYGRYLRRARVERRMVERLGIRVPAVHHDDLALIEERAGLVELRRALGRELGRLSDGQRQALQLRVVEECSYEEVASRLGVSEQTARARVSRGLRALTSALESHRELRKETT